MNQSSMGSYVSKAAFSGLKKRIENALKISKNNPDLKVLKFELYGDCEDKNFDITKVVVHCNDGKSYDTKL